MVSCTSTSTHKLLHTITHCSTLQHSATHCNTLRHTTTQCNTLQSKFISELTVEIFHQRYGARNDLLHTPLGKTCYTKDLLHTPPHLNLLQRHCKDMARHTILHSRVPIRLNRHFSSGRSNDYGAHFREGFCLFITSRVLEH